MGTMLVCDGGCGKQSPDEDGLHVANKWFGVVIEDRNKASQYGPGHREEYLLCADCAEPALNSVGLIP